VITSLQNEKVKNAIALRDRRDRDATGLFLIEGYREIYRALGARRALKQLFFVPPLFLGENEHALLDQVKRGGAELLECTEPVFRKLSYRDRPDGLVAVAPQVHLKLEDLVLQPRPFLVVAEAIEKPGNLGTILRCSDAVGVDALIVCDKCTDIHNPNVVRASVGTLFTVPVVETTSEQLLPWLKAHGIAIVATTPSAETYYNQVDLQGPIAIAMGTEQLGLSQKWLEEADLKIKIPMKGTADSLNVAMATTVALYEVLRQRCK